MTTVGLPQSLISTLPGSFYTDATIFASTEVSPFPQTRRGRRTTVEKSRLFAAKTNFSARPFVNG